jgi:hypothetical protein
MRAPHVIPLAFGDFLERVHEAAADFAALSPAQLASRLVQLGPPSEEDVLRAAADYDAWCIQMPIGGAWSTVFADLPFERSQAAIESLRSATEAIRGVESPAQGLTLRLPLGQGGPGSASLWLDIVRRLCRWNATVPSAFWTVEKGSLLLALGDAPPDVLPALWVRDPASPGVYDLTSSDPAPFSQRLSARPREVRVDAPMTEFLDSVAW